MASKPANEKLWATIVAQAKAKYATYPNPGASHWVRKTYTEHGGRFIETSEKDRRKNLEKKKFDTKNKDKSHTDKKEDKKKKKDK